jgi:hypothetical protein
MHTLSPTDFAGELASSPLVNRTAFVWTMFKEGLESAILQMSSTLKKRRAKMNKHKLRKRRKLARRKNK